MSKTDGKWFSHDNNTALDPKIVCLESEYGFEGSGRFWRLLEIIHTQEGYKYCLTEKVAYASLAVTLKLSRVELDKFLHYLINEIDLIQTDGEYIWNDSMQERMGYWGAKQKILSENGKKGAAVTNAKKSARLKESNGVAEDLPNDFSTNKTKPNETILNETKPNNTNNSLVDDDSFLSSNKSDTRTYTLPELRDNCMDDVEFIATYTQLKQIPTDRIFAWLNAFNKWLVYTADTNKDTTTYRKHFRNWFNLHDWKQENPDIYNPVGDKSFSKQPQRTIPMEMPKKTPQQLLAEQAAYEQELTRRLNAMDDEKRA